MRRQSKYVRVDPQDPQGAGQCDLCGRWYQLRELSDQVEWAGTHLYSFQSLRCKDCYDVPQEQLRTIILPPDPPPLLNARVPDFDYEEQTCIAFQFGGPNNPPWGAGPFVLMVDQTGSVPFIFQYLTTGGFIEGE